MIFDKLSNAGLYRGLSDGIDAALDYLLSKDMKRLEPGIHEISGRDIYAVCAEYETKGFDEGKNEAHRKYIDVQFIVDGAELMYASEINTVKEITEYDSENDVVFLEKKYQCELDAVSGFFAVFFPSDAHIPGITAGSSPVKVKKVVVKVHV